MDFSVENKLKSQSFIMLVVIKFIRKINLQKKIRSKK